VDLYDSEIYYNDCCLGEIVGYLKENGLYEETLLILLGDHGEAFGEHNIFAHGDMPYEEVLNVPLIIKFPHGAYAGTQVDGVVSLIDLFPTVIEFLGYASDMQEEHSIMGKSLLRLLDTPQSQIHDFIFAETSISDSEPTYFAVLSSNRKLIRVVSPEMTDMGTLRRFRQLLRKKIAASVLKNSEYLLNRFAGRKDVLLFDLGADPHEKVDLARACPDVVLDLERRLEEWRQACQEIALRNPPANTLTVKEDEILDSQLRALGYLD
jgi:arylsulfatase A-like enzyme